MNYSRLTADSGSPAYTGVTVRDTVPWRHVQAMLLLAAERTPGLCKEPQPFVLQIKLSNFYVEYGLNAALERTEERLPVLAKLHPNIQDVFNEHGVQLMSPHYIADPPEPVRRPKERGYDLPAPKPEEKEGLKQNSLETRRIQRLRVRAITHPILSLALEPSDYRW